MFVITHGSFVVTVTPDRDTAEKAGQELVHIAATEYEWRSDMPTRKELFYKSAHSGRWNGARVYLTDIPVSGSEDRASKPPRYEVRESNGYVVWDTHANRPAAGNVYSDYDRAQSYANVRNESHNKTP